MMNLLIDMGKGIAALSIVAFLVGAILASLPISTFNINGTLLNISGLAGAFNTIVQWSVIIIPLVVVIGLGQWMGIFGRTAGR